MSKGKKRIIEALAGKLNKKRDWYHQARERISGEEFKSFQKSLNASLQSSLDTTANAIDAQLQPWNQKITGQLQELEKMNTLFHKTIARSCFLTAMLGFLLVLGITIGAWGLTKVMSNRVSDLETQQDTCKPA